MSHSFDTGLTRAQRTLIRNGPVTLLSGLLRSNGGYLNAVIPWGGVVRSYTDDAGISELWAALLGRAPSIAIAVGDRALHPAGMGGFNFKGEVELVLYHYSNHPRDLELGRLEIDAAGLAADTFDPGLDCQMEHAEELLIGQYANGANSPTIKQIVPTREEELRTENAFTLWAQRYQVTVARSINPLRGLTQILDELRTSVRVSDAPLLVIANSPAGATEAAAIATFTTTTPHGLVAGHIADVEGVAVAGYNGRWMILDTPTGSTFRATLPVSGLAASGGGTVTTKPVVDAQNLLPP